LRKNAEQCNLFEFPKLIDAASAKIAEMRAWSADMKRLWNTIDMTQKFITESKAIKWSEMNVDELEDGGKRVMK